MDQPILVQRQLNYHSVSGHLQRAQTAPMSRDDILFSNDHLKRTTSPVPGRLPPHHTQSRGINSSYSTPMSITPSSTPPLVVKGVPLTSGAAIYKQQQQQPQQHQQQQA